MDPANCPTENSTANLRRHVVFRERHHDEDDDAPPFFVHFEHDGKSMVLTTPSTRESYSAVPYPGGG